MRKTGTKTAFVTRKGQAAVLTKNNEEEERQEEGEEKINKKEEAEERFLPNQTNLAYRVN